MSLKKEILWRVGILYLGFFLFGLLIIGKIVYLQVVEKDRWINEENISSIDTIPLLATRGNIYSFDGRLLATSVPYFEIRMDPLADGLAKDVLFDNLDSLSLCLFNLFRYASDKTPKDYENLISNAYKNKRRGVLLKSMATYDELQKIKKFPVLRRGRFKGGLIVTPKDIRVRPHDDLAGRFIGYTRYNNLNNIVGIEGAYDEQLAGENGRCLAQRLIGNIWIPVNNSYEIEPKNGVDVVTTIDVTLQDFAENALLNQLVEQNADHGTVVLMEVKTGNVKAIVNLGKDKSNNYREIRNYAVFESTDPGSTFKLPMLMAAFEDQKISLTDTINTGKGQYKYMGRYITDDAIDGYGIITVKRVFEVSSNIGMVKIISKAYHDDPVRIIDRLYTSMRLNEKLDLEILGEGIPKIKYPNQSDWYPITLAMMSFGYEIQLTPLQILTFYNAVANGGCMVKPRFVHELKSHGRTIKEFPVTELKNSICSKSTLKMARKLLEGVVENGTAQNLKNSKLKIAGKTGTCQIFDEKSGAYKSDQGIQYRATFVGYFPADNPKYSCIVVISSPAKSIYYGNKVAGPVFMDLANKVNALDISGSGRVINKNIKVDPPFSKDGNRNDIITVLSELNIKTDISNSEDEWVTTQKENTKIVLNDKNVIPNLVPNVVMMGAKDATYLLENAGLKVKIVGRGTVKNQSIMPGSRINIGEEIILEMSFI